MEKNEKRVDEIIDSIQGEISVGSKYYFFTVTYAYIGKVKSITEKYTILDPHDSMIVMKAGDSSDAVSQIVRGKMKPEICEAPGVPIIIYNQSLTCAIQCKE